MRKQHRKIEGVYLMTEIRIWLKVRGGYETDQRENERKPVLPFSFGYLA